MNLIPKKYTPVRFLLVSAPEAKPIDDHTSEANQ